MRTDVVTSQPVFNRLNISEALDQPPTYEEVISQQPKPSSSENIIHDSERISSMEIGDNNATAQLNTEQENKTQNAEEQQNRNNQRHTDCCFVCVVSDDPYCILCRLFSNCCLCIADCTESCCESCADCLHNCCESNTVAEQVDNENGCCDDCCAGNGSCCGDDCCTGDSGDCDCSCFD